MRACNSAALISLEAGRLIESRRDRRVDLYRVELSTAVSPSSPWAASAFVGIPGEPFVELGLALKAIRFQAHFCGGLIATISHV